MQINGGCTCCPKVVGSLEAEVWENRCCHLHGCNGGAGCLILSCFCGGQFNFRSFQCWRDAVEDTEFVGGAVIFDLEAFEEVGLAVAQKVRNLFDGVVGVEYSFGAVPELLLADIVVDGIAQERFEEVL